MSTLRVDSIRGQTTDNTPKYLVQVKHTQGHFAYQEVTTTSYVEVTNMNLTITPKFVDSKIKILVQANWWLTTDAANYCMLTLYRDIGGGGYSNLADDTTYDALTWYAPAKNATLGDTAILNYIDTPNTTDEITYKLYCRKYDGTNHVRIKYAQTSSLMTAEEIAQ
jgi:hypothetical protein